MENKIRNKTAELTGVPRETIDRIITWMWKKNREATRSEAISIDIPNLGYYKIMRRKIVSDLKRYKKYAEKGSSEMLDRKIRKILQKNISHPEWVENVDVWIEKESEGAEESNMS